MESVQVFLRRRLGVQAVGQRPKTLARLGAQAAVQRLASPYALKTLVSAVIKWIDMTLIIHIK